MKNKKILVFLLAFSIVISYMSILTSVRAQNPGDIYILYNETKIYGNSSDAKNLINEINTYSAGNYYIYKVYDGMINISKTKGSPGGWINPNNNLKNEISFKPSYSDGYQQEFIDKIGPIAQELTKDKDLYASVMIAQAALESGYGTSYLVKEANNFFGIKGNYNGISLNISTYEYTTDGERYTINANFKKYPSAKESLVDYTDVLLGTGSEWRANYYYGARVSQTNSYKDATLHLTGRYATSPTYNLSLNSIIERYNLTKYDNSNSLTNSDLSEKVDSFEETVENSPNKDNNIKDNTSENVEQILYINSTSNIRDKNLKIIDLKYKGQSILNSVRVGEYYQFNENGVLKQIHHTLVTKDKVKGNVYVKFNISNIRSENNNLIIGKLNKGEYINGYELGDYIFFTHNNQKAKVHKSLTIFANPEYRYINANSNIRDNMSHIVEIRNKGYQIYAVRIGDYYRFYDNGVKFIYHTLTSSEPVNGYFYVNSNTVNVRDENNNIIDVANKGYKIYGHQEGNYVLFKEKGINKKIHISLLSTK